MRLHLRRSLLVCVVAALALGATPVLAQQTVRLAVGESEAIQVREAISKVQPLNPHIADVADYSARGVTIVGVSAGQTELHITAGGRLLKYTIIVTAVQMSRLLKDVRMFLGRIEGIIPRIFGEKVILDGEALTAEDYMRAEQAVRLFGDSVRNWVRLRPQAAQQLTEIFQRAGLVGVKVSSYEGRILVEGAVGSKDELRKVDVLLQGMGIKAENMVSLGRGRQVLIDVSFVEMNRADHNNIGVQLPGFFSMSFTPTGAQRLWGSASGVTNSGSVTIAGPPEPPYAAVNMLSTTSYARILAQPRLVCSSGEKASLLVGGEIPIVTITAFVVNVTFKEFGIKLEIEPVADNLGNITSVVAAEVSEPDPTLDKQGYPGFRTRRVKSQVSTKEGTTIVLSGLYANLESKAVSRFPLLGHIPVIGEFFRNREMKGDKTSLAIFITPRVVSSQHRWVQKTVGEIQRLYDDYEKKMGWELVDW
jgi:pilus assembly protein CpaC